MQNVLLSRLSDRFLTTADIEELIKEYSKSIDVFAENIGHLARQYHKLNNTQQENLKLCITEFFEACGYTIAIHTKALCEKRYKEKHYATHWQNQLSRCNQLREITDSIVSNAEKSADKEFAYFVLLKNEHYVLGKYKEFEDEFYARTGQIETVIGLFQYYSENRMKCKGKLNTRLGEIKECLRDANVSMVASVILNDSIINDCLKQINEAEFYMKDRLKHFVNIEENEFVNKNKSDDDFLDL